MLAQRYPFFYCSVTSFISPIAIVPPTIATLTKTHVKPITVPTALDGVEYTSEFHTVPAIIPYPKPIRIIGVSTAEPQLLSYAQLVGNSIQKRFPARAQAAPSICSTPK